MRAEILSIGSEITSGQNLDTNSQWLSQRLAEMGIATAFHTTVGDDLADNIAAIRLACERANLVILSGGLGPTQDDLTREALAQVAGVDLVLHQESFEAIEKMYSLRGRVMPERNRVQALFPKNAEPLPNLHGTAPGIYQVMSGVHLFALPGVPSEMRFLFEEQVKPRLEKLGLGGSVFVERKINCFGTGESHLEEKLFDLTRRGNDPEVGITVSDATISLRIRARAANSAIALERIAPVEKVIRERLGDLVFGIGDEELEHAVVQLLREKKKSLATAESVTCGLVARRIGKIPGASEWFRGGVVSYQNSVKTGVLGVPASLIAEHDVISGPVVEAMAVGVRKLLCSDLAIATVGLAGPGGGTPDKPVGLVYAALASEKGVKSHSFNWVGDRQEVQSRTAKLALNLARLHLIRT